MNSEKLRKLQECSTSFVGIEHVAEEAIVEVERLEALINTPHTTDFIEAVQLEAAHQIERWGVKHDEGKRREDWITLVSYLVGKLALAHFDRDDEKLKHRIVATSAALLNWFRAETGDANAMRPGILP